MTTYNFTTNELAGKLPLSRGAVIHSIKWVKMAGDLQDQAYIRAGYDGRQPTGTNVMSANMVELMLGLDGHITDVQQDGDQVTVTTDASPEADEPVTLYDLARQAVEKHAGAFPVDSVGIWKTARLTVFIRRYNGALTMHAINGNPHKSQRVRCGYVGPNGWHFDLSRADYDRWASRAKRLVSE